MAEPLVSITLPGQRLYNNNEVHIRTFTIDDIRIIYNGLQRDSRFELYSMLGNCISMDVNVLTMQDLWYIMYWERINSYLEFPLRIPWKCPYCDTQNNSMVSEKELDIRTVDPDYEHGVGLKLPSNIEPVYIRLQLVKDDVEITKFFNKHKNTNPSDAELQLAHIAAMLEPTGTSFEERYALVTDKNRFTPDDLFCIQSFEQEFDYGVQQQAKFRCYQELCGKETTVSYSFTLVNFFPGYQDRLSIRSRILPRKVPSPAVSDVGAA